MTTPTPRTDRDFPEGALHLRTTDEFMARIRQQERDLAAREAELAVAMRERNEAIQASLRDMTELAAMKQRAEAAERELESVKAENSKLRSALDIVHFKREPWQ